MCTHGYFKLLLSGLCYKVTYNVVYHLIALYCFKKVKTYHKV